MSLTSAMRSSSSLRRVGPIRRADTTTGSHVWLLIDALGARTAVLGGLTAARQAEEAAGFVMRVVAAGANLRFAVPDVDPGLVASGS